MKKCLALGLLILIGVLFLSGCQAEEQADENEGEQASTDSQENAQIVGIAETFIDQLSEGKYEKATEHFDETMSQEMSVAGLEEVWLKLQQQVGDYIDKEYQSIEEAEGYQVVVMAGIFNDTDVS